MTREERIAKAIRNKDVDITKKKSQMKKADGIVITDAAQKSVNKAIEEDRDEIEGVLIINTTNYMDSHKDVHLPGLWTKSLNENRNIMHLQEHKMEFEKIIADGDDLQASTKMFTWAELGYPYQGTTEALMFNSTIKRERNEYMFNQYKQGRVNNHSVGMSYVKIEFAADDPEYKDNWEKYLPMIANKEVAEENGYFYIVFEAKAVEGSAVPIGSNTATPTHSIKSEPLFGDTLTNLKSIIEPGNPLSVFFNQLNL